MKYITEAGSETGKKFQRIVDKRNHVIAQTLLEIRKHGSNNCRSAKEALWGGCSVMLFEGSPPPKNLWKKVEDGFMPKQSPRAARKIADALARLEVVTPEELNGCVGFTPAFDGEHIGFNHTKGGEYFGFSIDEDADFTPPKDCEEVTVSHFKKLFK